MQIKNAEITETMLGLEGHGIFSFMIYLGFNKHSSQGFGGWVLGPGTDKFIKEVLKVVGVEKWEDLKGKAVRAAEEDGRLIGIGNLFEEQWFYPKDFFEKLKVANEEK